MAIEKLIGIVREAAELMQNDTFEITQKGGYANIVTSSDIAVQAFLKERLSQLLPGSGFLCEEEDVHQLKGEDTWIIDPIDGTANYARGIDQCGISVALKHQDEVVMGVVYLPRTGELFSAEKGRGACLNGRAIHVSGRPFADAVMCTALSVYHKEYTEVCSRVICDTFRQCNDIRGSDRRRRSCVTSLWDARSYTSNTSCRHGTMPRHPSSSRRQAAVCLTSAD